METQNTLIENLLEQQRKAKPKGYFIVSGILLAVAGFILFTHRTGSGRNGELPFLLFGAGGLILLAIAIMYVVSNSRPITYPNSYKKVSLVGATDATEREIAMTTINQQDQQGNMLFQFKGKAKTDGIYMFPSYLVMATSSNIALFPPDRVWWAYKTTHRQNGAVTHYTVNVLDGQLERSMIINNESEVHVVLEHLREHYGAVLGYHKDYVVLYRKDKDGFSRLRQQQKQAYEAHRENKQKENYQPPVYNDDSIQPVV